MFDNIDIQITLKDGRVITHKDIGLVHLHWVDRNMQPDLMEKVIKASDEELNNKQEEREQTVNEKKKMILAMLSMLGGMNNEIK